MIVQTPKKPSDKRFTVNMLKAIVRNIEDRKIKVDVKRFQSQIEKI